MRPVHVHGRPAARPALCGAGRIGPLPAERTGTEYTYRIVRPGTYEATIVANARRPDTVGGTREYDYRIAGDRLFITTYPQTTVPAPASRAVRVESESARVGCAPAGHAD